MDIDDILRLFARYADMSEQDRKQIEKMLRSFEDLENGLEDFDVFLDSPFESDSSNSTSRYRHDAKSDGQYDCPGCSRAFPTAGELENHFIRNKDHRPVEVEVPTDMSDDSPYHGKDWLEVDGVYETWVELDNDIKGELSLKLRDGFVSIQGPVEKELPVHQLPEQVTTLNAELRDNMLLVRVYSES